jgi:hypothetical protein
MKVEAISEVSSYATHRSDNTSPAAICQKACCVRRLHLASLRALGLPATLPQGPLLLLDLLSTLLLLRMWIILRRRASGPPATAASSPEKDSSNAASASSQRSITSVLLQRLAVKEPMDQPSGGRWRRWSRRNAHRPLPPLPPQPLLLLLTRLRAGEDSGVARSVQGCVLGGRWKVPGTVR